MVAHVNHYWVGHKDGYLFCSCGVAKVNGIVYPLEYIKERAKNEL